jgi:hypothetical protein
MDPRHSVQLLNARFRAERRRLDYSALRAIAWVGPQPCRRPLPEQYCAVGDRRKNSG